MVNSVQHRPSVWSPCASIHPCQLRKFEVKGICKSWTISSLPCSWPIHPASVSSKTRPMKQSPLMICPGYPQASRRFFDKTPRYCCCDGCLDNGHLGQVLNQTGHSDVLLTREKLWTSSKCIHQHQCNPIKPPNSWQHPCHPNIWQTKKSMTMQCNSVAVYNSVTVQQLTANKYYSIYYCNCKYNI